MSVGRAGVRASDPVLVGSIADANPTELKRKHQVKDDTQGFNFD